MYYKTNKIDFKQKERTFLAHNWLKTRVIDYLIKN